MPTDDAVPSGAPPAQPPSEPSRSASAPASSNPTRLDLVLRFLGWAMALTGVATVLFLSVYYAWASVPFADDFGRTLQARSMGTLEALSFRRENWTGRWSGIGLAMIIGKYSDLHAVYPFCALAFLFIFWLSIHWIVCAIWKFNFLHPHAFVISLLLYVLGWSQMPVPGESFYWLANASNEHLSLFMFAGILFFSRFFCGRKKFPAAALAVLFAFILAGVHEIYTLMSGFVVLMLAADALRRRRPVAVYWLLAGVSLLAGLLFVLAAPGAFARVDARFSNPLDPLDPLVAADAIRDVLRWIAIWIGAPTFIAVAGLILFGLPREDGSLAWLRSLPARERLLLILLLLICLFLANYGFLVALGVIFPRARNLFMVFTYFTALIALLAFIRPGSVATPRVRSVLVLAFGGLFLWAVLFTSNGHVAIADIRSGKFARYVSGLQKIHRTLPAFEGRRVVLTNFPDRPGVLSDLRLRSDADFWGNRIMAEFYNLESIRIAYDIRAAPAPDLPATPDAAASPDSPTPPAPESPTAARPESR